MISLPKLLQLKYPEINIIRDVKLCDYKLGNGPEIQQWFLEGVSQPSQDDLDAWQSDLAIIAAYTAEQNAIINAPIIDQLDIIDAKSVRALRTNDTGRLADLESQAVALRAQLVR